MIEFGILIVVVVLLWAYRKSIRAFAVAGEDVATTMATETITANIQRRKNIADKLESLNAEDVPSSDDLLNQALGKFKKKK